MVCKGVGGAELRIGAGGENRSSPPRSQFAARVHKNFSERSSSPGRVSPRRLTQEKRKRSLSLRRSGFPLRVEALACLFLSERAVKRLDETLACAPAEPEMSSSLAPLTPLTFSPIRTIVQSGSVCETGGAR